MSLTSPTQVVDALHACVLSRFSHIRLFATTWTVSSVHGDSPGKNTGVGCHALLQGIFLTQGSNPCLLYLLISAALASGFFTSSTAWEAQWDREDTDYAHIWGSGVGSDKSRISGAPEEAEALDML